MLCTFACTVCQWLGTRVSPPLFGQRDNIVKLFVVPLDERDSRTARVNSISETIRFIFPRVRNVHCFPPFPVSLYVLVVPGVVHLVYIHTCMYDVL